MSVLETPRLALRELRADDAEFILTLLNEPSFLQYIGDRNVRNVDDARRYIASGPVESYARNGFGLYLVERKEDGSPLGMCGLLRRDTLPEVDIGFAFLPAHWGRGYAFEAASAAIEHARSVVGLRRLVAIVSPDNEASMKLLARLGFTSAGWVQLTPDEPAIRLFSMELAPELPEQA